MRRSKTGAITEDTLKCPLVELELIAPTADRATYEFNRGPKTTLPDGVFNFALGEYWQRYPEAETLTLERLAYEPGSPGRTFKLDERSIAERLSRIDETSDGVFRWSDTAGLQQVQRTRADIEPMTFLRAAYVSAESDGVAA